MKKITFLLLSIMLLWACGSSDKNQSNIVDISDLEASISPELLEEIVEKHRENLDELLTLEMAASTLGLPAEEAEKEIQTVINAVYYKWDNGRTKMLSLPSGTEMEVPALDQVALKWFRESTLNRFMNSYREPTKEELGALDRILGEETEKLEMPDEVGEVLEGGMGDALTSNLQFTDVEGVGELARWNTKVNELPVYYKGISFIIHVESGKGDEVDKELAIKVAKDVLKKL